MNSPTSGSGDQNLWINVTPNESIPIQSLNDRFDPRIHTDLAYSHKLIASSGTASISATIIKTKISSAADKFEQASETISSLPINETVTVTDLPLSGMLGDVTGTPTSVSTTLQERMIMADTASAGVGIVGYISLLLCGVGAGLNIYTISKAAGGWKAAGKSLLYLGQDIIDFKRT